MAELVDVLLVKHYFGVAEVAGGWRECLGSSVIEAGYFILVDLQLDKGSPFPSARHLPDFKTNVTVLQEKSPRKISGDDHFPRLAAQFTVPTKNRQSDHTTARRVNLFFCLLFF